MDPISKQVVGYIIAFFTLTVATFTLQAQDNQQGKKIIVSPDTLSMKIDEEIKLEYKVVDGKGNIIESDTVIFFSRNRRAVNVSPEGMVKAVQPGKYQVVARTIAPRSERIYKVIPVEIAYPPLDKITLIDFPSEIYDKTTIPLKFKTIDVRGIERNNVEVTFSSSNTAILEIGKFNKIRAKKTGNVTLTARAENVVERWDLVIKTNPVSRLELSVDKDRVRTGDVVHINAKPLNSSGEVVGEVPVTYSFNSVTDDELGEGAAGLIEQDGRFVANKPGYFTLIAHSSGFVAEETIRVNDRDVKRGIELVDHGAILDKHTSDLWVWEGVDGRDYAVTGTWGAAGEAFFWDVTDPSNMKIIDTVTVDARTVNDVKISEDGRIGVITREGASDRKNGIVILDVTNPQNVKILSEYNNELTGGVHNAFIWNDHVFAVNNGRRYDIINIEDPENPRTVSRFELDTPGHSIHDVWIENGLAYSSNWSDGVVVVDVGSTTTAGTPERHDTGIGSPENPVKLGSYAYPSGRNHAAFPFKSKSTGDFYVVAGDESFPYGLPSRSNPVNAAGYIHFIKFEGGWDNPKEVARYEVPEAGSHNFWIKDDTLYVAYYNAGLRVVDISGELLGKLYDQGREIARFEPNDPDALIPNSPFTWGPQPYKGHIFFSDWNSGLWVVKLEQNDEGTGTN